MHANVREYEPREALFVPDDDALQFYRAIARAGRRMLRPGGKLYFEIYERSGRADAPPARRGGIYGHRGARRPQRKTPHGMQQDELRKKKFKTPEQALAALMRLCARAEKSQEDARRLMRGWGLAERDAEGVLAKLVRDRFIDDAVTPGLSCAKNCG